jgi:hypothetical protein
MAKSRLPLRLSRVGQRKQFLHLLPCKPVADAITAPGRAFHIVDGSGGFRFNEVILLVKE